MINDLGVMARKYNLSVNRMREIAKELRLDVEFIEARGAWVLMEDPYAVELFTDHVRTLAQIIEYANGRGR